ncbi:6-phosphogluconolactonase [Candidatus Woesearchaeota archaeon]|nr:6-phosphogluconolactonase [Candidatus Woesearchaeota archaeon]
MAEVIARPSRADAERAAAEIIAGELARIAAVQDKVVIGLCGGTSVAGIYTLLGKMDLPWEKTHFFMADERFVPLEDRESNFRLASEHLFRQLLQRQKIRENQIHPFRFQAKHPDLCLIHYIEDIKKAGGKYDIVVLSSGEDGHIAALYPSHHSIKSQAALFIVMDDSPKMPKMRMTASRKLLSGAKSAILLFFGEGKREAFKKFNDKNVSVEECPAKLVEVVPRAFVVTDLKG